MPAKAQARTKSRRVILAASFATRSLSTAGASKPRQERFGFFMIDFPLLIAIPSLGLLIAL